MDGGDIGLGNSLGENSEIYGSIDTNDFGFPGPKGAKLKYWGHLSNGSSYALDAIRRASRGIIKWGTTILILSIMYMRTNSTLFWKFI